MNRKHQRAEMALHRERVSDSFQELLAGTEDLLRSTASYTGSEIEAARAPEAATGRCARIRGGLGRRGAGTGSPRQGLRR